MHHDTHDLTSGVLKEILKETRSMRRWRFVNRLVWLVAIMMIGGGLLLSGKLLSNGRSFVSTHTADNHKLTPHIAVVSMHGVISQGSPVSIKSFIPILEKAFEAENSVAVFINANSPGGSPVQSAVINDAIARLKKKYNKPVIAVISDLCASGCYYAIAGVDKIVAHNSSIIGSIGVRLESYDLRQLIEKIGIKQRLLTAGENKAILNPFAEFTDKHRTHLQALIDESHNEFILAVEEGRGAKLDETNPDLFSGLIWLGAESIELGLVDELGDLYTEAENYSSHRLVYYQRDKSFVEEVLGAISQFNFEPSNALQAQYR